LEHAAVQDIKAASVTAQLCVTTSPGQVACMPSTLEVSVRVAAGEGQHNLELKLGAYNVQHGIYMVDSGFIQLLVFI